MNNREESINLAKVWKVIELCSGIGAQIKGIKNTKLFIPNVVATADLDKEVVVSYAAIHCGLTNKMIEEYKKYPSKEQMVKDLSEKRLGYDFKKNKPYDWKKLSNKKDKTKGIEKYWLADHISRNLGDVTKIKQIPSCDLLTYSMPCTDMSIAGKQEGLKWTCQDCGTEYDPSKLDVETRYTCPDCNSQNVKSTRSGLLYEVERLLVKSKENNNLPKFLLMENVDALVSKKYIDSFNDWIDRLENLGYNSYYQTINAKNTGVPQNRNRIFCISILKDIDTKQFEFPNPFDLGYRLRDFLEDEVDEKYYLSQEIQDRLQITDETFNKSIVGTTKPEFRTIGQRDLVYQKDGTMGALMATDYEQPKQILDNIPNELQLSLTLSGGKWDKINESCRRVYSENGIAPTLHTCGGGNTEPKVVFEERRDEGVRLFKGDYIGTLRTIDSCGDKRVAEKIDGKTAVRKLTPKEAHRLMGFDDIDYEKCKDIGMSDSQGYKQSGNSIVVNVIALLIEHLYKSQFDNTYICFDENFTRPQAD